MARVVALMVLAAACSSASGPSTPDLRSVLFTNPEQSAAYIAEAFDSLARARFDTTLLITAGAQVCLKFDRARLQNDVLVKLHWIDQLGYLLGTEVINVADATSWTWDGTTSNFSTAPPC